MNRHHDHTPYSLVLSSFLIPFIFLYSGCTNDPEVKQFTHYFNPIWSYDGKLIVAIRENHVGDRNALPQSEAMLVIRDIENNGENFYDVDLLERHSRFWIDPSGQWIAIKNTAAAVNGLPFYSTKGEYVGSLAPSGIIPAAISFRHDGKSLLWAAIKDNRLIIGKESYLEKPWVSTSSEILKDTIVQGQINDVVPTSWFSYAVRLSNGTILEYNFVGSQLSKFHIQPRKTGTEWQRRLYYFDDQTRQFLYTIDDSGLVEFDLVAKKQKMTIIGTIINLDLNTNLRQFIFETRSGDLWTAVINGEPLGRFAQCIMPSISMDGRYLAAVKKISSDRDELTIVKLVQ